MLGPALPFAFLPGLFSWGCLVVVGLMVGYWTTGLNSRMATTFRVAEMGFRGAVRVLGSQGFDLGFAFWISIVFLSQLCLCGVCKVRSA